LAIGKKNMANRFAGAMKTEEPQTDVTKDSTLDGQNFKSVGGRQFRGNARKTSNRDHGTAAVESAPEE